jgi:hypothetical protein
VAAATAAVLRDPRPKITSMHTVTKAGIGNALFTYAAVLEAAAVHGFLPVFPCTNMLQKVFWRLRCADPAALDGRDRRFRWADVNANRVQTLEYEAQLAAHAAHGRNVLLSNYGIDGPVPYYHRAAVCAALAPTPAMQAETHAWFAAEFWAQLPPAVAEAWDPAANRIVAVHVRRGDFVKSASKGVLTAQYYADAWALLRARVRKSSPGAADRLVVAVFHDKAAEFAAALAFPGAAAVVVLSPKSTYRRAREMYIDLFALALGTG